MATSAPTFTEETVEAKFARLARRWKAGRGPESSVWRISVYPAYQQIIGMGEAIVPLILRELESNADHWFWALNAITGADPVPESGRGVMSEMIKAWLHWGTEHGY